MQINPTATMQIVLYNSDKSPEIHDAVVKLRSANPGPRGKTSKQARSSEGSRRHTQSVLSSNISVSLVCPLGRGAGMWAGLGLDVNF